MEGRTLTGIIATTLSAGILAVGFGLLNPKHSDVSYISPDTPRPTYTTLDSAVRASSPRPTPKKLLLYTDKYQYQSSIYDILDREDIKQANDFIILKDKYLNENRMSDEDYKSFVESAKKAILVEIWRNHTLMPIDWQRPTIEYLTTQEKIDTINNPGVICNNEIYYFGVARTIMHLIGELAEFRNFRIDIGKEIIKSLPSETEIQRGVKEEVQKRFSRDYEY